MLPGEVRPLKQYSPGAWQGLYDTVQSRLEFEEYRDRTQALISFCHLWAQMKHVRGLTSVTEEEMESLTKCYLEAVQMPASSRNIFLVPLKTIFQVLFLLDAKELMELTHEEDVLTSTLVCWALQNYSS